MTGDSRTSSTFSSRAAVPAAMVVAEFSWLSLFVNAAVNASGGPHVDLPFLAMVVPALMAVAVGAGSGRLGWRWWWQGAVLIPGVLVGAALSAGVIGEL